jgi:hypothetical protein
VPKVRVFGHDCGFAQQFPSDLVFVVDQISTKNAVSRVAIEQLE